MVQPVRGMAYSITLIVQFHDTFVTAADKAFQVRCFYRERTVDVNANTLDVRSDSKSFGILKILKF